MTQYRKFRTYIAKDMAGVEPTSLLYVMFSVNYISSKEEYTYENTFLILINHILRFCILFSLISRQAIRTVGVEPTPQSTTRLCPFQLSYVLTRAL